MNILKKFDKLFKVKDFKEIPEHSIYNVKKFIREEILKIVMSVPCKDRIILKNPHYTAHIKEVKKWRDNVFDLLEE